MNFPTIDGLNTQEQTLYNACVEVWRSHLNRNLARRVHYDGHVDVASLDDHGRLSFSARSDRPERAAMHELGHFRLVIQTCYSVLGHGV